MFIYVNKILKFVYATPYMEVYLGKYKKLHKKIVNLDQANCETRSVLLRVHQRNITTYDNIVWIFGNAGNFCCTLTTSK